MEEAGGVECLLGVERVGECAVFGKERVESDTDISPIHHVALIGQHVIM